MGGAGGAAASALVSYSVVVLACCLKAYAILGAPLYPSPNRREGIWGTWQAMEVIGSIDDS